MPTLEEIIISGRTAPTLHEAEVGDHVPCDPLAAVFMSDEATHGDHVFKKHKHVRDGKLDGWTWERIQ